MTWPMMLLMLLAAPKEPIPADVVRLDSSQSKDVVVESQEFSNDHRELTVFIKPKNDKFMFDIDFTGFNLKRLKIVIRGVSKADTVRYFPDPKQGKYFLDLLAQRGVTCSVVKSDYVIECEDPVALRTLAPGGRLLVRSVYGGPKVAR